MNGASTTLRRESAPTLLELHVPEEPKRVEFERAPSSGPGLGATIQRWARIAGGRVNFSLTYPVLAGIGVGVIVLVALAFVTGRRVGERAAPGDLVQRDASKTENTPGVIGLANELGKNRPTTPAPASGGDKAKETAKAPDKPKDSPKSIVEKPLTPERSNTPDTHIVANPGSEPAPEAKTKKESKESKSAASVSSEIEKDTKPTIVIQRGKHYIQIQCFPKDHENDAERAAQFLREYDVPVMKLVRARDVVLYVNEVFTVEGVDAAAAKTEKARAGEIIKRVKALGRQYAKEKNGRYTFDQADLEKPSP